MHISKLEKWWMRVGVTMLVAFLVTVGVDAFMLNGGNSHGSTMIDPAKVSQTPPFDKPGTFRNKDGSYDAVVVAYAFGFLPKQDLEVPVGVKVHFKVASVDVVHGFQIPGRTNVNLEVVPGHVSEVTQTFPKPGRYLILCHEYCGSGHHFMTGHIRVLKPGEKPGDAASDTTPAADAEGDTHDTSAEEHA